MNKNLDIRRNTNVLFVLNIVVLITMVFFRNYYGKLGYTTVIINSFLIINIILLIIGIVYNILFIKNPEKYDTKKVFIIMIIIFGIYFITNTVGTISINKMLRGSYSKISSTVSSYCDKYVCDKYETISKNGYEEFIINNTYYDLDNKENKLKIVTRYSKEEVISVTVTIFSRKQSFSEVLIKENIKEYFYNLNIEIDETKIRDAFNKRFDGIVKDKKITYKVREVYDKKGNLKKLKTIIKYER